MRQKSKTTKSRGKGQGVRTSNPELRTPNAQRPTPNLDSLRKRAEAQLKKQEDRLEGLSTHDVKKLIHEVGTYQIELEMQNEELWGAAEEVEASRARYADLYDLAPVGYFTFDKEGTVLEANLTGAVMLGIDKKELIKKPFSVYVHRSDQDTFYLHRTNVFETGDRETCELRLKRKDGSFIWTRLQSISVEDIEHQTVQCRTTISDITSQKNAEAALRESEERYRSIFEGANDGIISCDLETMKFPFVNKRMCELTGYPEEELLNLKVKDLHPITELPYIMDLFNKMAAGKLHEARSVTVLRKDGSVIYCDISSSFMKINDSSLLLGFFRDVTEREAAESALRESEQRFRNTFENAAVGIVQADTEGKFIQVNQTFCDITGYSRNELLGMTYKDITHPDDLEADMSLTQKLLSGEIDHFKMEKKYVRKDGHIVWGNLTLSIRRDEQDDFEYVIGVIEDISEKKKTEGTLQESLKELERSNRELEQFAYIVSHDLKEPLRMIISYIQLMNKKYANKLDTDADEYMNYIVDGARRMDALLSDLLSYSRVGRNAETFQPVDLNSALNKALSNLKRIIDKREAQIFSQDLPTVMADEVMMIQLFQNLVGNAVKFHGDEPTVINITAEPAGNEWTIRVSDNGIGIDPDYLDRIFLVFRRLHPRGKYSGTGIGLSICKKIVERHEGRIWAESPGPGRGAVLCFTIERETIKTIGNRQ